MVLIIVVGGVAGFYAYSSRRVPTENVASTCHDPGSIWSHVYNPDRLQVVSQCITVSGRVETIRPERDGDYHIQLHLDPAFADLTNDGNNLYQDGNLVLEIICVGQVTQLDAESACENYTNGIAIPELYHHITVSGPYVLDTDHHNWAEIHPVYSLTQS